MGRFLFLHRAHSIINLKLQSKMLQSQAKKMENEIKTLTKKITYVGRVHSC